MTDLYPERAVIAFYNRPAGDSISLFQLDFDAIDFVYQPQSSSELSMDSEMRLAGYNLLSYVQLLSNIKKREADIAEIQSQLCPAISAMHRKRQSHAIIASENCFMFVGYVDDKDIPQADGSRKQNLGSILMKTKRSDGLPIIRNNKMAQRILEAHDFKWARTYAKKAPHWYIVKDLIKPPGQVPDRKMFLALVKWIRKYGVEEEFQGYTYTVLPLGLYKYWTMFASDEETTVLNCALVDKRDDESSYRPDHKREIECS